MKVDVIVFSPPYSESVKPFETPEQTEKRRQRLYALGITEGDHKRGGLLRSIRAGNQYRGFAQGYGKNRNNIGNLRHGPPTNSEVEEEQVGNVLFFKPTPGFQGYKQFFHSESVMHPAKANLNMLRWIIERYTKEGDVVLDPMAGTGSTGIIACYLNRKAILIDLEQKFVDMMKRNIERFKRACKFWKVKRPKPVAMQGDSRQLSNVLRKVDSIIFSPPFSEQNISQPSKQITKWWKKHRPKSCEVSSVCGRMTYSENKSNIGNLPHGKIDAIITSPPFSESDTAFHDQKDEWVAKKTRALEKVSNSKENIATLKHGEIDAIITSPPYEATFNVKKHTLSGIAKRDPNFRVEVGGYGKSDANLGNLHTETYLSAMLKVYRECWKVLKPNGKMVIIVKNFIRNKKIVRLDLDTIKLCEKAGFQLVERWYSQLKQQSFWRIIYAKKYPSVPKIRYEHILVFQKER